MFDERIQAEKRTREETERNLREQLHVLEDAILSEERRQREAERKRREQNKRIELEKKEREAKAEQAEKKRQRDELNNCNSPKALQELRELIRVRYELDMEIWRRKDESRSNRDLIQKLMVKSDEVLANIRSRVERWNEGEAFGFEPEEWELAKEIKARLLADGKRIWGDEPPWEVVGSGTGKLPKRPPPHSKRPPPHSKNKA